MHRLVVVLLLYAGCAFSITAPDPDRPRSKAPVCDTGKGSVVLDGAMATTGGIIALSVLEESPAVALIPAAIGALYLAGAIKGNSNANKCREAMSEYDAYIAARDTMPRMGDDDDRVRRSRPPPEPAPTTAHAGSAPIAAPASVPLATRSPVAAATAAPAPAVAPGAKALPAAAQPAPAKPAADDDWSDFWREVE